MRNKMILISIAGMLASHPLQAQQAVHNEYILKVKPADIDKLGKALGKLPYEEVIDLMQNLRMQVMEQQSKPVEQPKPKK